MEDYLCPYSDELEFVEVHWGLIKVILSLRRSIWASRQPFWVQGNLFQGFREVIGSLREIMRGVKEKLASKEGHMVP